ncbi:MAG: recombinase family protein [Candidatus Aminicenantes bacterium]|nr:MAG: recombinase family protein [Candidatus Aminicenantes bacterium]
MISKIRSHHQQKKAYVYLRQSTMGQVRHHQESTERQYALADKAKQLGWPQVMIKVLDGDLGISGAQSYNREDFKTLVADVSMRKVGAVFALEASRLSRSNTDWHRLIELCALTDTLIIDEDGCYDPTDFNDRLLLGLKATMSQAELHFIHVRLRGGKLNKAKKGLLRLPLPLGLCYDDEGNTIFDPDEEVRNVVKLIFSLFQEHGSAYEVVRKFASLNLKFPKRAYGGIWDGKLIWGYLTDNRVLNILHNPSYAGAYVFGRYRYAKNILPNGQIQTKTIKVPMSEWTVKILNHHEGYISWEEFCRNEAILSKNQTNKEENLLSQAAREGKALLQGLLLCNKCGRRLTVRYKGNGGIYPTYECKHLKREGLTGRVCMSVQAGALDRAISERILEVIEPEQIKIALKAIEELEMRNNLINKQWGMKIERAEYEAQLAQRRYEQVDPENRLVASTLESRWNDALIKVEQIKKEFSQFQQKKPLTVSKEQKEKVFALAKDLPGLWNSPTTKEKDKKRILRLLIKDITVEKFSEVNRATMHIRWQGGACEDIKVNLPQRVYDKWRYSPNIVERVKALAPALTGSQIAERLNKEGLRSAKGKPFNKSIVDWIRYKYDIPSAKLKRSEELTVKQVAEKFGVSQHVVYYWIERKFLNARRINNNAPYWITLDSEKEKELCQKILESTKIQKIKERTKNPKTKLQEV